MPEFPFKPRVVGWELTLRCNMRCLHCGSSAGQPRDNELTVDEGYSLIDQLVELGTEVLTLSGGEPMTHPAWDKYAKRLVDAGVRTYMISNGLLLEQNLDKLLACGLKRMGVSIDGGEKTHDLVRNHPGSFRAALAGASKARAAGVKVGAITHVSGANINDLEEMYSILSSEGFDFWQVQIVFCQGRMLENLNYKLDPQELPRIVNFVVDCQKRGGSMQVVAGDNFGYYEEPPMRSKPWKGCVAGRHLVGIDSDGNVKGCLSLPRQYSEGNIRQEPLRKIWEDPERFRFNRYFSPDMLTGHCSKCPHAIPCRAGCSTLAYSATGNRFDNPFCAFRVQSGKGANGWDE